MRGRLHRRTHGGKTALITIDVNSIGQMSCNPAIGGIAKGHLVREVDALGVIMGQVIDATGIQFRLLNRSRGPAVQSPRAQADRNLYRTEMRRRLERAENLTIIEGEVAEIKFAGSTVAGVELAGGDEDRRPRGRADDRDFSERIDSCRP